MNSDFLGTILRAFRPVPTDTKAVAEIIDRERAASRNLREVIEQQEKTLTDALGTISKKVEL